MITHYDYLSKKRGAIAQLDAQNPVDFYLYGSSSKSPLTYYGLSQFLTQLHRSAQHEETVLQTWFVSMDLSRFFDPPQLDEMSPHECIQLFELVSHFQTLLEGDSLKKLSPDIVTIEHTDMVENVASLFLSSLSTMDADQGIDASLSLYPFLARIRSNFTSKNPENGPKFIRFIEDQRKLGLQRAQLEKIDLAIATQERALRQRHLTVERVTALMQQITAWNQPLDVERTFFAACKKRRDDLLQDPHEKEDEPLFQLEQNLTAYLRGIPTYYPELRAWTAKPHVMRIFVFSLDHEKRNSPLVLYGLRPGQNDHDIPSYRDELDRVRGFLHTQLPETKTLAKGAPDEGIADCPAHTQKAKKEGKEPVKFSKRPPEKVQFTQATPPTAAINLVKPGESSTEELTFKLPACSELEEDYTLRNNIEKETSGMASSLSAAFKALGITVKFEGKQDVKAGKKPLVAPTEAFFFCNEHPLKTLAELEARVLPKLNASENASALSALLRLCEKLMEFTKEHTMSKTPYALTAWANLIKAFGETASQSEERGPKTVIYTLITRLKLRIATVQANQEMIRQEIAAKEATIKKENEEKIQQAAQQREKERADTEKAEAHAQEEAALALKKQAEQAKLLKFILFVSLLFILPVAIGIYYLANQPSQTLPRAPKADFTDAKENVLIAGNGSLTMTNLWEYEGTFNYTGIPDRFGIQAQLGFLEGDLRPLEDDQPYVKYNLTQLPDSLYQREGEVTLIIGNSHTHYSGRFDISRALEVGHIGISFVNGTFSLIMNNRVTSTSKGDFELRGENNQNFQLLKGTKTYSDHRVAVHNLSVPMSKSGNPNFNRREGSISVNVGDRGPESTRYLAEGTFDVTLAQNPYHYLQNLISGKLTVTTPDVEVLYQGRFMFPFLNGRNVGRIDHYVEQHMTGTKTTINPKTGDVINTERIG